MRLTTLGIITLGLMSCKKESANNLGTCKGIYNTNNTAITITNESSQNFCLLDNYDYQIDISNLNLSNIQWDSGENTPNISINIPGTYSGYGLNNSNDTIGFIFEAQDCDNHIYIPNAFTPNGDGLNDTFKVYFEYSTVCEEDFRLSIFDATHQLIYQTNNYYLAWDGTTKGLNAPQGVYHYILEYKREDGEVFEKTGQILLMI